jgi:hypothetical protein
MKKVLLTALVSFPLGVFLGMLYMEYYIPRSNLDMDGAALTLSIERLKMIDNDQIKELEVMMRRDLKYQLRDYKSSCEFYKCMNMENKDIHEWVISYAEDYSARQ